MMLFLLQIPPPKPPPPEMHFISNPANSEFVYLLGLEECVSKILHEDKDPGPQPMPFTCSQCDTDFTPTWKWDKEAKGTYLSIPIFFLFQRIRAALHLEIMSVMCIGSEEN